MEANGAKAYIQEGNVGKRSGKKVDVRAEAAVAAAAG